MRKPITKNSCLSQRRALIASLGRYCQSACTMFTCRACTRRALAIVLEASHPVESAGASLSRCAPPRVSAPARTYGTDAAAIRDAISKRPEPKVEEKDDTRLKMKASKTAKLAANKQLKFLHDPYHIAKEVEKMLAKDRLEEATLLAQTASKSYQVPVSWNYLIDYQMRNQRLHAAMKLFNEMKKRGQLPTAATYTTIFRGCAKSEHPKLAVAEAVKLYNNMLASERITPNTIHMNAVLQVCARAGDIETMFTIIKSRDQQQHRAADSMTYTTILHALRATIPKLERSDIIPVGRDELIAQTIQRARAIWEEVIAKWRAADITMDENLACAMGRILLMGDYHANNEIFQLLEQTMDIPKDPELLSKEAWKGAKVKATSLSPAADTDTASDIEILEAERNLVAQRRELNPSHKGFARPSNNAVSLAMEAIQNTGKVALARRYWIIFTKIHGVVPDAQNWDALLKALRRGRSSTKTAGFLSEMPKRMMAMKTFRTAMNTCLRDNLNKSSFNNATRVLEIMLTSVRIPDMLTLRLYLRVAFANKRLFQEMGKKKDPNLAKLAWGRQICTALENLWEPYQIAAKQFTHGRLGRINEKKFVESEEREAWVKEAIPRAELAALARKMIAACDRLIFDNMVPPNVASVLAPRRNQLNKFVVKYFEDREKYEPGWNRKLEELEAKREKDEEDDDWDTVSKW